MEGTAQFKKCRVVFIIVRGIIVLQQSIQLKFFNKNIVTSFSTCAVNIINFKIQIFKHFKTPEYRKTNLIRITNGMHFNF